MYGTIRFALGAALLMVLFACGGGSTTVEGTWQGSYIPYPAPSSKIPLYAVIKSGRGYFYDRQGLLFAMPDFDGGNVGGTVTVYPPYGDVFITHGGTGNSSSYFVQVSGSDSHGAIKGAFGYTDGSGAFDMDATQPFTSTPSVVAGTWSGAVFGGSGIGIHVDVDGNISGNDGIACTVTGTVKIVSPGENLFDFTMDTAGASTLCGEHLIGLAYESDSDELGIYGHAAGTYYYVATFGMTKALVAEFKVQ